MSDTEEAPAVEEVAEMSVLDALREVRSMWWCAGKGRLFSGSFDSYTAGLSRAVIDRIVEAWLPTQIVNLWLPALFLWQQSLDDAIDELEKHLGKK